MTDKGGSEPTNEMHAIMHRFLKFMK